MTFANISVDQEQRTLLSQVLLTVFPGCTIHQSRDPMRTVQHISSGKIDIVFTDADACSDLIPTLRARKMNTSVYLLCRQDRQPSERTEGIQGIVTYPITKQKIQLALQTAPREIREVI